MIDYSTETMNLYNQQFASRVIHLTEQGIGFGYRDQELVRFYEHPTNQLGIEEVAKRLGALGKTIRQDYE